MLFLRAPDELHPPPKGSAGPLAILGDAAGAIRSARAKQAQTVWSHVRFIGWCIGV